MVILFIIIEAFIRVGKKNRNGNIISRVDVNGECFGFEPIVWNLDFICSRCNVVLSVLVVLVAIYGNGSVGWNDVKIDGRYSSTSIDKYANQSNDCDDVYGQKG